MALLLAFGLVLTIVPAALLILFAGRLTHAAGGAAESAAEGTGVPLARRRYSRFLLVASVILLLPFAIFTGHLFTDFAGLLALLFAPALVGVWALAILNWRGIRSLLDSDRALAVACLVLFFILLTAAGLTQRYLPLVLIGASLAAAAVLSLVRRLQGGALVAVSLLCILLLLLDASGLASGPMVFESDWLRRIYEMGAVLAPLLALACAALLVRSALKESETQVGPHGPTQGNAASGRKSRRRAVFYLILAALVLLSLCAAVYRDGVMVSATGRALEDHLPFFTVGAAVIAGVFLALAGNSRRSRYAGIGFAFVASLAILVSFQLGGQLDAQAVTAARARRIVQALGAYRGETGTYPESLAQLTPGYLPVLLGPVNGRGTRWCYQGKGDAYRLGYVLFQRYSALDSYTDSQGLNVPELRFSIIPSFSVEVISRAGDLTGSWMCAQELRRMKATGGL